MAMTRKLSPVVAIAALAAVLIIVAVACAIMWRPAIAPISPPASSSFDPQLRREGARVVALGDCVVCHTAKGGKPFAGGLPLVTPFGTIYATNITPDPATGIGAWSIDAFKRALRHEVSRDGHILYPAFPYIHFTRMSDRDISAAYAYLMTRDAVEATTPDNKLIFPLNFRPLVAFCRCLKRSCAAFTRKARDVMGITVLTTPRRTPPWSRARFLGNTCAIRRTSGIYSRLP